MPDGGRPHARPRVGAHAHAVPAGDADRGARTRARHPRLDQARLERESARPLAAGARGDRRRAAEPPPLSGRLGVLLEAPARRAAPRLARGDPRRQRLERDHRARGARVPPSARRGRDGRPGLRDLPHGGAGGRGHAPARAAARLHARPRGDRGGGDPAYAARLPLESEQPDGDDLPARRLGGLSPRHAHAPGDRRRRRCGLPGHQRRARRRQRAGRHAAHLLEALRARRAPHWLRRRARAGHRDARPRAPALQRQRARPGGCARRPRRPRARSPHAAHEPRGHGLPRRGVSPPGARLRAERGELRARARRRGGARLRGAAARRRDRAPDGRLRLSRARAGDGGPARGERALRRGARPRPRTPMTPLFARMTVAGVGLIGGSLAAAARRAGLAGAVVGFGRSGANLALARARGLVDRTTDDPAVAAAGAEVIVLAAPVGVCAALAAQLGPPAAPGTLLTDVGSVKGTLVTALEAAWQDRGPVVGAHPLAGSEAAGAGAARADLFVGRRCILTPTKRTDPAALARVRALWEGVGARVEEMAPAAHDALLARISHLPHLLAYALVTAAAGAAVDGRAV